SSSCIPARRSSDRRTSAARFPAARDKALLTVSRMVRVPSSARAALSASSSMSTKCLATTAEYIRVAHAYTSAAHPAGPGELAPLGLELLDLLADVEELVLDLQDLAHLVGPAHERAQRVLLRLQAADAGVEVDQLASDVLAPDRLGLHLAQRPQVATGIVERCGRHPDRARPAGPVAAAGVGSRVGPENLGNIGHGG